MRLFHLPPREVAWERDISNISTPLNINIEITLDPPELFGEAEFTDTLRAFPTDNGKDRTFKVSGNFFAGMGRLASEKPARFQKFNYKGVFANTPVEIIGNNAQIACVCLKVDDFYFFVQKIIEEFPSSFSCATNAPVSISQIKGSANGIPFTVRMKFENMMDAAFKINDDFHAIMSSRLDKVLPECGNLPKQIVAAMRYLSQAFLLEFRSVYSYYFLSERMLNVCKAIESLTLDFGDKVDDMRKALRSWQIHERYIDVFASIRYLRSQLDIAHIAYSQLNSAAYNKIQKFLPIAEQCTQMLIISAIDQYKNQPNTYKDYITKGEEPTVLKKLVDYESISLDNIDLKKSPSTQ